MRVSCAEYSQSNKAMRLNQKAMKLAEPSTGSICSQESPELSSRIFTCWQQDCSYLRNSFRRLKITTKYLFLNFISKFLDIFEVALKVESKHLISLSYFKELPPQSWWFLVAFRSMSEDGSMNWGHGLVPPAIHTLGRSTLNPGGTVIRWYMTLQIPNMNWTFQPVS